VADLPGDLEFVREALDGLVVQRDLGPQQFEGDFLLDVRVEHLVDPAHAAVTQLLDHLVSAGERGACGEFADRCLEGFCELRPDLFIRDQLCPAVSAEPRGLGIIEPTLGAFEGHKLFPFGTSFKILFFSGRVK